jgi:high-affinity nickel-transport protein
MIGLSAFAVFALGLRHGADPDHIAAIDNMTRNSFERKPWLSRFVGTIFAGGHSIMVLSIAALVGLLGTHLGAYGDTIETIGTWISIAVLVLIAVLNLRQLKSGTDGRIAGVKTRLLPRVLREATSPWIALPVGLLFGFGFETSSQILAYSVAFGVRSGVVGALLVGAMFCFGMICTDTLDSVLVHRLVSDRVSLRARTMRVWIWSVTLIALAVAGYELLQLVGIAPMSPTRDLYVSYAIVAVLLTVFAYVFVSTKRARIVPSSTIGTPS